MTGLQDQPEGRDIPEGGDDQAIGVALKRSLLVLTAVLLLIAAGIGIVALLSGEQERILEKHTAAPVPLVADQAILPQLHFTDVTDAAGIDFVHVSGATGEKLLPETMGSGAAFLDVDGDLDQDLLLVNATRWPDDDASAEGQSVLLLNDGSGQFLPSGWDLGDPMYGTGVACGDVDFDGLVDVFIAGLGENRLLRNTGSGFEDHTADLGLGASTGWATSPAFADVDGDGDLDLFICTYIEWTPEKDRDLAFTLNGTDRAYGPPKQYAGMHCVLLRNDGSGHFEDVSDAAGMRVTNAATGVPVGKALAVAPVDLDRDGDMDFIVANDTTRNFLFRNRGDGTFDEVGEASGLAYDAGGMATGAMGIDVAHFANDDRLAVGIGNFANEMTSFYVDSGEGRWFSDEALIEGIGAPTRPQLSFGLLLFDVDLDGRLDLFQTNGHLEEEISQVQPSQSYRQPAQLFWNAGAGRDTTFEIVPPAMAGDLSMPIVGRGAAVADIDGDGDGDLLITQPGESPMLLRNDQATGNHWLRVVLEDPTSSNTAALGAWIECRVGDVTQRRQVQPTRSYLSQVELPVTFGLGLADAVDSLEVIWPDGIRQEVEVEGVDQLLRVQRQSQAQ
ncbi:MAG: CRTAC1 family protein [Phycisphaerales bacterium]|nr:CRTAC1 family protein [Phycisphaerales bacterium]